MNYTAKIRNYYQIMTTWDSGLDFRRLFLPSNQSVSNYYLDLLDNYQRSRWEEGSPWYWWWHLMILIALSADRLVVVTGHCVSSLHHVLASQHQQTDWSVSQPPGDWGAELAVRWNVLEDVQCQLSLVYSGLYISTRTSHHSTHDPAAVGLNGKHSATPHWDMLYWNTVRTTPHLTHHLLSNGQMDQTMLYRSHQARTWDGKNGQVGKTTTKDKFLN